MQSRIEERRVQWSRKEEQWRTEESRVKERRVKERRVMQSRREYSGEKSRVESHGVEPWRVEPIPVETSAVLRKDTKLFISLHSFVHNKLINLLKHSVIYMETVISNRCSKVTCLRKRQNAGWQLNVLWFSIYSDLFTLLPSWPLTICPEWRKVNSRLNFGRRECSRDTTGTCCHTSTRQ